MKGRRGISPLIATILLVAFTVAVAAFLATWSKSYTEEKAMEVEKTTSTELACGKAGLKIVSCSFVPGTGGVYTLQMLVKNSGKIELGKFHMVAIYGGDMAYDYPPTDGNVSLNPSDYRKMVASGTVASTAATEVLIETETCVNVRDRTASCTVS